MERTDYGVLWPDGIERATDARDEIDAEEE